ncbi:hypothetical protein [Haladaptatus sp. T7]|uniref:hypothetical protein n=1 Tax=Haladaptatus sp. T7 TaxID=2029368 RepID=UPI0021A25827|nr:hypothetical protein [Haladaptatus sp. T7]GKZ12765.1 hypothetical protein HAL_06460 [Haladaptatus sp. T7]
MSTESRRVRGNVIGIVSILLAAVAVQLSGSPLPDFLGLDAFVWFDVVGAGVLILHTSGVFEE